MSIYPTRRTPTPRDEPPHMPAVPQTSYVLYWSCRNHPGTPTPPISVRRNEPDHPSLVNVSPIHQQSCLQQMERSPTEATPFNVPRHVLPRSPLAPIGEHPQVTGFAPPSSSTPYEPLMREPPPGYPTASPSHGAPSPLWSC